MQRWRWRPRARVTALRADVVRPIEIPESHLATALQQDPVIMELTRELQEKRRNRAVIVADAPAAENLKKAIAEMEDELQARQQGLCVILREEAEDRVKRERQDSLRTAESQLELIRTTVVILRERIDLERQDEPGSRDLGLELQFAREELKRTEGVHQRLADRITQITTEGRALDRVNVIQKATLPEFPEEPTVGRAMAIAGPGTFLAPFLLNAPFALVAAGRRARHRAT